MTTDETLSPRAVGFLLVCLLACCASCQGPRTPVVRQERGQTGTLSNGRTVVQLCTYQVGDVKPGERFYRIAIVEDDYGRYMGHFVVLSDRADALWEMGFVPREKLDRLRQEIAALKPEYMRSTDRPHGNSYADSWVKLAFDDRPITLHFNTTPTGGEGAPLESFPLTVQRLLRLIWESRGLIEAPRAIPVASLPLLSGDCLSLTQQMELNQTIRRLKPLPLP